jgi:hypothetical protein
LVTGVLPLKELEYLTALDDPHEDQDDGSHEKEMDEAAHRMGGNEPERPKHDQDHGNCPQNGDLLFGTSKRPAGCRVASFTDSVFQVALVQVKHRELRHAHFAGLAESLHDDAEELVLEELLHQEVVVATGYLPGAMSLSISFGRKLDAGVREDSARFEDQPVCDVQVELRQLKGSAIRRRYSNFHAMSDKHVGSDTYLEFAQEEGCVSIEMK